jgi:hypothetical protein
MPNYDYSHEPGGLEYVERPKELQNAGEPGGLLNERRRGE